MHQRFYLIYSIVVVQNPVESCPSIILFSLFRRLAFDRDLQLNEYFLYINIECDI